MFSYIRTGYADRERYDTVSKRSEKYLSMPVSELELSTRSRKMLDGAGITTIRQLVSYTETNLLMFRNFGTKSFEELRGIISKMGLRFGMRLES